MRAATGGSFRNTLGSVSIAVETASPVVGHLIITELMVSPPIFGPATGKELLDRDRRETVKPPAEKV